MAYVGNASQLFIETAVVRLRVVLLLLCSIEANSAPFDTSSS